jgi:hypothetical protein
VPSSMIFAGLVVIWLLILVPAVARHRQEVARPSVAALSGRVLERPRRRQNLEVDVMDEVERSRPVAVKADREDERPRVPAARAAGAGVTSAVAEATREPDEGGPDGSRADHGRAVSVDDRPADLAPEVEDGYAGHDAAGEDDADDRYEDDSY